MSTGLERREFALHGRRLVCHVGGSGPTILLLHGITSSAETWNRVAVHLAGRYSLVVPDLPGHGESDEPPGDYSLGANAATVRDLLALLDVPRVTIVGHSLGGGIALQMAYLFPELVERLVLVSSGGLGAEVHALLRAATLPGAELVLPLLSAERVLDAGDALGRALHRVGITVPPSVDEVWQGLRRLRTAQARSAFVQTARAVIGLGGQRVSALARLYLAETLPTLVVWGGADRVIPAAHGRVVAERLPACRFELFERSGHFPHTSEPRRFARVLTEFMTSTQPAALSAALLKPSVPVSGATAAP